MRRPLACAMAIPLAAAGCMVGPDFHRPPSTVNDAWLEQDSTAAAPDESAVRWWENFRDPQLAELIEQARRQNLSLRIAGLRVIQARAARGIAVGEFFPQSQGFGGSISMNQISANDALALSDRSFVQDIAGFYAAWELDFWGRFRRGIEASDAEVLASVAQYDAVFVSLAADVAANYILVRSAQERLQFARANVALQEQTVSLTETRFRAGAVSELDVATARATLANTRALIPELMDAMQQAKLALCILLGRTPSELARELALPEGASPRVPDAPPRIAAGVPADLVRRRPDVRAAERTAAAQSARIGQAVANLLPQVSIVGQTGFAAGTYDIGSIKPELGNIFDADSFTGFLGLEVNWPILNYGRIISDVRVKDAQYEQAVAAFEDSVLRAAGEVESGLSAFLRARERAQELALAVKASERSVELSLIQYRLGAVDFIRVNIAQSDLVQQQDALVTSRAATALGAVRAYRALGGGWEVRGGDEFIDPATAERMRKRTNWGDVLAPGWSGGEDFGFKRPEAPTTVPAPAGAAP